MLHEWTHWPLGGTAVISNEKFQTNISNKYLNHLLWNSPQVNTIKPHRWWVNIVLCAIRQHAITWNTIDMWQHMDGVTRLQWVNTRATHIYVCISKLTIIGLDSGLLPGRHQAIIRTNAGILLIWPLGTNFSEISIKIYAFSFKKMHLKMSSEKSSQAIILSQPQMCFS